MATKSENQPKKENMEEKEEINASPANEEGGLPAVDRLLGLVQRHRHRHRGPSLSLSLESGRPRLDDSRILWLVRRVRFVFVFLLFSLIRAQ